jgi:hypothetical protein
MKRHRLICLAVLAAGALAMASCGSDDDPVTPEQPLPDTTAPFAIADLMCGDISASSVTLSWTATGDDTSHGTADAYDVRYSLAAINDVAFAIATQATGEPAPKAAGQTETFTVTGLVSNTKYYFAVKAADEDNNWSPVSNCPDTTTDVPDLYNATNSAAEDAGGVYSPDGSELAFWSARIGAGHDIYVKDARTTGGQATRLTTFSAGGVYAQFPSWSPDGEKIVFQCNIDGTFDLWVVNRNGGGPAVKLTTEGGANELYPEWSHDGTQIAFSSDLSGQSEVYTIPAAGGSWSQITSGGIESASPTWSPDDMWIAYHHWPAPGKPAIYKIRLSDSHVVQVTVGGSWAEHPSWSPDGLFVAFDQAVTSGTSFNVSYVSADGGAWNLVSTDDGINDRYPSWSPDGRRITYSHYHSSQADITIKLVR